MKWNVNQIVEFLKIYKQYPLLWNINHKEYGNTKLKIESFQRLFGELDEKQLIMEMDMKQLKSKIKSIKDVYRQELYKVVRSMESGCGLEEMYYPKLAWFHEASFLSAVMAKRSHTSKLNLSQYSKGSLVDKISEMEYFESEEQKENFMSKSPGKMRPPATPMKRANKRTCNNSSYEISEALDKIAQKAQNSVQKKPYDMFGKFVASELQELPERKAILLQQELHNCIVRCKLASLDEVGPYSPCSNNFLSSNTDDLLKKVIFNTFGPSSVK